MPSLSRLSAFIVLVLMVTEFTAMAASPRTQTPLEEWQFTEDLSADSAVLTPPVNADWKPVKVPHVFRQSGLPDNTAGWYRRIIHLPASARGQHFFLMLEGAASVKDVFVNGQHLGQHKGAFSRCDFDLTPALKFDAENTLDVRVSNRDREAQNCFSRSTLYYVNGGMFRPAWLIETGAVHIFPESGSTGVFLTPRKITPSAADLEMRTVIQNSLPKSVTATVRYSVSDPQGKACGEFSKEQALAPGEIASLETTGKIADPQLWDLGKPNLYTVRVQVRVGGEATDEITERTGFRTIAWKNQRFFLNGREVQFRGVNKHEQTEYDWNAVSAEVPREEWQSMADLGVNAVRLAHYPHADLEYRIADERGIAVWAENGYSGQIWKGQGNEEKTVTPDGERLTREMVLQNWNHPSILFWSAGNETIVDVVSHYAALIRAEDNTRLVTYAANGKDPQNCDFIARNTYDGWYGGHISDFAQLPRNTVISETGAGDWITHHIPYGTYAWKVDKYEPEEYAELFTEFRLQTVCRNAVAEHPMFLWWNFREFYNLKFKLNRNTKGLLTLAGEPKDLYYLFQAFFNPTKPVLHLCGREYFLRTFAPDNGIKAYSNAAELQLTLNGVACETLKNGSYKQPDTEFKTKGGTMKFVRGIPIANVFFWRTPLQPGRNLIEVTDGKGHRDRMVIYQKSGATPMPVDSAALVQDLRSSNPASPAVFIDRPVEAQGTFYTEVDGSSDNTFDVLPKPIEGAAWIATRRLSDPKNQTDLAFRINPAAKGATISVLFSTGHYPTVTLKKTDAGIEKAAASMRAGLAAAGFQPVKGGAIWRDHELNRADAELWRAQFAPGAKVSLPGQPLDYVVLVQATEK